MLSPIPTNRWDFDTAAHLLVRAGFGGSPSEIQNFRTLGSERAVDSLINAPVDGYPSPTWATPYDEDGLRAQIQVASTPEEKQMANQLRQKKFNEEMKDLSL